MVRALSGRGAGASEASAQDATPAAAITTTAMRTAHRARIEDMEATLAGAVSTTKKAPAGNRSAVARVKAVAGCALTAALAAMGGRWKLFIVYRLSEGPMHFAAL